jgi:hypothetical protein
MNASVTVCGIGRTILLLTFVGAGVMAQPASPLFLEGTTVELGGRPVTLKNYRI